MVAPFVVRIPESIYEEMVARVIEGYPNEACGALGSVGGQVVKHYPTANAAEHPDDFSIIAETDLVRIFNDIDTYDGEMIYYHSHPHSEAYPSPRDREWAQHSGYLYIIFSHRHYPEPPYARVFSIDGNGEVTEGRVEMEHGARTNGEKSMAKNTATLTTFYKGWDVYQKHLITAIAPLTPDQLTLRAAPDLRSIGMIATHIIGARARWFHHLLGEGDPEIAVLAQWDRDNQPTRTASELVRGLENSWQMIQDALARWVPSDLERTFQEEWGGEKYSFSLQWVLWHLIEHDLHHGGEISLTLGMHGLAAPDI